MTGIKKILIFKDGARVLFSNGVYLDMDCVKDVVNGCDGNVDIKTYKNVNMNRESCVNMAMANAE